MKKLLKLMLQNNMLRMPEGDPANGEDGANGGGGADKGNDLSAEIAALKEQIALLFSFTRREKPILYIWMKKRAPFGYPFKMLPE